jgi:hypothetical protein
MKQNKIFYLLLIITYKYLLLIIIYFIALEFCLQLYNTV